MSKVDSLPSQPARIDRRALAAPSPSPEVQVFRSAYVEWMAGYDDEGEPLVEGCDVALGCAAYDAAQAILTRAPRSWGDVAEVAEVVHSLVASGEPPLPLEPLSQIKDHDDARRRLYAPC